MAITFKYIDVIGNKFPTVGCYCVGDGAIYEDIVWQSGDGLPAKTDLDTLIIGYIIDQMSMLILAERDRRKSGGVLIGANWFNSDDASRIQQIGLVMMGANMPNNIMWKTMSGSFVLMTPTLAGQIFQTIAASDMFIFSYAEQLRISMLASSDPGNFNYLVGWPAIYGE